MTESALLSEGRRIALNRCKTESDRKIVEAAYRKMVALEGTMTAYEIELACGIPEESTLFFNHLGVVPTGHVMLEAQAGTAWLTKLLRGVDGAH